MLVNLGPRSCHDSVSSDEDVKIRVLVKRVGPDVLPAQENIPASVVTLHFATRLAHAFEMFRRTRLRFLVLATASTTLSEKHILFNVHAEVAGFRR